MRLESVSPPSPEPVTAELLERYLAREVTASEHARVDAWLAQEPRRRAIVESLRAGMPATTDNSREMWTRLSACLSGRPMPECGFQRRHWSGQQRNQWSRHRALTWVVATLAVLAIVWGMGTLDVMRHRPARALTYTTGVAQRVTVMLADGTQITLAPQTTLTVDPRFGRSDRSVTLSGEAYFNVHTATGAPFVVRTGTVSTRVLGTTFAVRRYAEDDAAYVAVMSGRVVAGGRKGTVLSMGTRARITDSTASPTSGADERAYTDWSQDHLVFDGAPVPTVLVTVGRWYGYRFTLADSALAKKHVTAAFKMSDAADMIATLKAVLEVDLTFNGNLVTLTPRDQTRPASGKRLSPVPVRGDVFKPSMEMGK